MKRSFFHPVARSRRAAAVTGAVALMGLAGTPALAYDSRSYTAWADVIDVEPLIEYRTVDHRQRVCSAPDRTARVSHFPGHRVSRYYSDDRGHRYQMPERRRGPGAAIVGGIIGGIIGHQFGSGSGKDLATIGGAIAGAAIADNAATRRHGQRRDRHRYRDRFQEAAPRDAHSSRSRECWDQTEPRTVSTVDGYRVTYTYQGRTFTRVMDSHPGTRVEMNVQVTDI